MTRLPFITNDNLDEDQQAVWDSVTSGNRGPADLFVRDDGALHGPFNPALHAPATGRAITELGAKLRFATRLDKRLLELAVCTTGAHWRSNFEWFAHRPLAEKNGIDPLALDAIERGVAPNLDRADEQAVYAFTRALLTDGRADSAVYDAAHVHVGDHGMVELTQLVGFYCMISFTLNAFEIELPVGNEPVWPY